MNRNNCGPTFVTFTFGFSYVQYKSGFTLTTPVADLGFSAGSERRPSGGGGERIDTILLHFPQDVNEND